MASFSEMLRYIDKSCNSYYCSDCPARSYCDSITGDFKIYSTDVKSVYDLFKSNEKSKGEYWENICNLYEKQRDKGIKKYDMTLGQNRKPTKDKIQYIQEELIDALMYLEWVKDGMNDTDNH